MPPKKKIEIPPGLDVKALENIPDEWQNLSLDEIERLIRLADLQTTMLDLERVREDNASRIAKKLATAKFNRELQENLASEQAKLQWIRDHCRHRSGGYHNDITQGDGKPCIARTQMLDGVTIMLQCLRCRTKVFTPHPSLLQTDPNQYREDMELYKRMLELSYDSGMSEIRGPTFQFVQNGVPIIPVRV